MFSFRLGAFAYRSQLLGSSVIRGVFCRQLSQQTPVQTMSKSALVLLTDGSEEIEFCATVDILRRANVKVTIASLKDQDIATLSRDVQIKPDKHLSEVANDTFDAVVLPGGAGHKQYGESKTLGEILKRHESNGKIIAAICAGPIGLKAHEIAPGAMVTAYPSVVDAMKQGGYKISEDNVVVSSSVNTGNGSASIVTSRGPATTFEFALKIVELLAGNEVATSVRKALLL